MLEHKSTKIFEISPHPAPKNFLAPLPAPCLRRIMKLYYRLLIRNEPPRESRIYLHLCPLPEIFQPQPRKNRRGAPWPRPSKNALRQQSPSELSEPSESRVRWVGWVGRVRMPSGAPPLPHPTAGGRKRMPNLAVRHSRGRSAPRPCPSERPGP